jgi:hypothetical protein
LWDRRKIPHAIFEKQFSQSPSRSRKATVVVEANVFAAVREGRAVFGE